MIIVTVNDFSLRHGRSICYFSPFKHGLSRYFFSPGIHLRNEETLFLITLRIRCASSNYLISTTGLYCALIVCTIDAGSSLLCKNLPIQFKQSRKVFFFSSEKKNWGFVVRN